VAQQIKVRNKTYGMVWQGDVMPRNVLRILGKDSKQLLSGKAWCGSATYCTAALGKDMNHSAHSLGQGMAAPGMARCG
jgi:hypothetical protein